jgi:hypothetical protein
MGRKSEQIREVHAVAGGDLIPTRVRVTREEWLQFRAVAVRDDRDLADILADMVRAYLIRRRPEAQRASR